MEKEQLKLWTKAGESVKSLKEAREWEEEEEEEEACRVCLMWKASPLLQIIGPSIMEAPHRGGRRRKSQHASLG